MRRLSGVILAGAMLVLPALSTNAQAAQQAAAAPQKFTMDGDLALWSVSIRPDKTADYEQVLGKVKEALTKQGTPDAQKQLAGWKVVKAAKPMPDGNIVYTHVIQPVPGADYSILQVLYATFTDPAEQKSLYDLYVGAFAGNLGLSSGTLVVDMSK
jgi:hypothetical protein